MVHPVQSIFAAALLLALTVSINDGSPSSAAHSQAFAAGQTACGPRNPPSGQDGSSLHLTDLSPCPEEKAINIVKMRG